MKNANSGRGWSGNNLTLQELSEIEANAQRSKTAEAATILRLAAALREAMQVSAAAYASRPEQSQHPESSPQFGNKAKGNEA